MSKTALRNPLCEPYAGDMGSAPPATLVTTCISRRAGSTGRWIPSCQCQSNHRFRCFRIRMMSHHQWCRTCLRLSQCRWTNPFRSGAGTIAELSDDDPLFPDVDPLVLLDVPLEVDESVDPLVVLSLPSVVVSSFESVESDLGFCTGVCPSPV